MCVIFKFLTILLCILLSIINGFQRITLKGHHILLFIPLIELNVDDRVDVKTMWLGSYNFNSYSLNDVAFVDIMYLV